MKPYARLLIIVAITLMMIGIPVTAFAAIRQAIVSAPTAEYACEVTATNLIDVTVIPSSVDNLVCPTGDTAIVIGAQGVQGPKGDTGPTGLTGSPGATGPTGPAGTNGTNGKNGIPFSQSACSETGLTGSAQQENMVFCISGIEPDGGLLYKAVINAANHRVLVGTPIAATASTDWNNAPITYVEFTSGLHAEYHADNVVRFYNAANQQV